MATKPKRAHEVAIRAGADTAEDLAAELRRMAGDILRGEITAGRSGGPSSGSIYAYRHDPAVTHESYFASVDIYLEELRA